MTAAESKAGDMMLGMRRWLLALCMVGSAGCGPIAYVHGVTVNADNAIASARAAHADKYSPYYWTRATQYLHMAREVAAHADFQGATRFGRLATEAAKQAEEEASDPAKRPVNPTDGVAPAKDAIAPVKDAEPAKASKDLAPAKDSP
ncbi:MAG: hypothetical protein JWO36_5780 [Myxococcales bacterium]|nr:hypothetical protein [Myxococcales bacterium]